MTPQTEKRVVSFVRTIAGRCSRCLQRNEENCRNCLSLWANSVLTDIEADREGRSKHIDYSIGARCERIIMILAKANRPLSSREINLDGLCSFQLKMWTLHRLCRRNIIGRKIYRNAGSRNFYVYFIKSGKNSNG